MIEVIAVDLDLTLVDTRCLDNYRNARDWRAAIDHIPQTRLYYHVQAFFQQAADLNIPVVVVSNSPSNYVHAVLDHHRLNPDMVIGYHDMPVPKPSPEWFSLVQGKYGCHPDNVVYLGNEDIDAISAERAGIDFYGTTWGAFSRDVYRVDFKNFLEVAHALTGDKHYTLQQERDLYFCGYYLSRPENFIDAQVRSRLLGYKDNDESTLTAWERLIPSMAAGLPPVDLIVRALGHAEREAHSSYRDRLWFNLAEQLQGQYIPTALRKNRVTRKSTSLNRQERQTEALNSYEVALPDQVHNADSILVVDDVYTTGATIQEIKRAILAINPKAKVYAFTLLRTCSNWAIENLQVAKINTRLHAQFNRQPIKTGIDNSDHSLSDDLTRIDAANEALHHTTASNVLTAGQKKLTASYTGYSSNFVLHNLPRHSEANVDPRYISVAKILKNLLLRGAPTSPSRYLVDVLGNWRDLPKSTYLSSRINHHGLLQKAEDETDIRRKAVFSLVQTGLAKLTDYGELLQTLLVPFIPVTHICAETNPLVADAVLDLVLPEANLVIQLREDTTARDQTLDTCLRNHGYEVICFSPVSVLSQDHAFTEGLSRIQTYLEWVATAESPLETSASRPPILFREWQQEPETPDEGIRKAWAYQEIIQLQVAILECLILGHADLNQDQAISIRGLRATGSATQAVDDLNIWLQHLCRLQDIPFEHSLIVNEVSEFQNEDANSLKFDIDILASGYDLLTPESNIVYIRRDPLTKTLVRSNSYGNSPTLFAQERDYFELEVSEPITYAFSAHRVEEYRDSLEFLLHNIFFPNLEDVHFREGQLGIVMNCLKRNNTVGLLPTGSGKSVCYQLSALLQPAISFVVCPIKSLMYDQKADLDAAGITRTNFITGDQNEAEKDRIQRAFSQGKYFFVFISPERFQQAAFRDDLQQIGMYRAFAYAVIDEIHCMSEWGHDFRTSYLNLAQTINRFASGTTYIGLTATASVNVLADIQTEFQIPDEAVKTPSTFGREELVFNVVNDKGNKYEALCNLLTSLQDQCGYLQPDRDDSGIIFSNTVNGQNGCAELADRLSIELHQPVKFYSGSKPKYWDNSKNFDFYKQNVQKDFKEGAFRLLTATKAFGMGINKSNISFTIHFGIPSSMEALYQEAGRAGRDKARYLKNNALCTVLLGEDRNIARLDGLWDPNSTVPELDQISKYCSRGSDLSTVMFLFLSSIMAVGEEYKLVRAVYDTIVEKGSPKLTLSSAEILSQKVRNKKLEAGNVEKAIFRLSQLGVIKDWTVKNFFTGIYELEVGELNPAHMAQALEATIQKYEADFTLDNFEKDTSSKVQHLLALRKNNQAFGEIGYCISMLLNWSLDHFAYGRRQSLKTVYEQCYAAASGKISQAQFKQALESYFQFGESSDLLKLIADDPTNILQCFKVFYLQNRKQDIPVLCGPDELLRIKEQLSRFLESYKNNTGLDLISGLLRLKFNDFDDIDGERRYHSALRKIIELPHKDQAETLRQICLLFQATDQKQQEILVRSTSHIIDDIRLLNIFNEGLSEGIADSDILTKQYHRLSSLMGRLGQAA